MGGGEALAPCQSKLALTKGSEGIYQLNIDQKHLIVDLSTTCPRGSLIGSCCVQTKGYV